MRKGMRYFVMGVVWCRSQYQRIARRTSHVARRRGNDGRAGAKRRCRCRLIGRRDVLVDA